MTRAAVRLVRAVPRPARAAALFLVLFLAGAGAAAGAREWPAPTGHVNDFAHVIDPASADSIEALAEELAVVTLPDLGGLEIEEVATDLFTRWGIGRKGENDGVLILLALKERRVRIEPGYGLEGPLPDGRLGGIIRRVMGPDLSANRFGPGLLKGARAVAVAIAQEKGVALTGTGGMVPPPLDGGGNIGGAGVLLLLFIFLAFLVLGTIANRASRGRRGRGDWSGRWGGWYGPWGGGFGGMGGLGGMGGGRGGFGGFGGFGGGMSGGGGASGRF